MVSHYGSYYAYNFYDAWMREYASEMVSIFFVMAGLGSYYSFMNLERRHGRERLGVRMAAEYYLKRAFRIYPLYWLALFTIPFILPGFGELHQLSAHTLAIYLAYPAVKAPGVYWFIPALVQCYLLAPLVFLALKRLSMPAYMLMVAVVTALFMLISHYYDWLLAQVHAFGVPDPLALFYRPMFMANLVLFALGMAVPRLLDRYPQRLENGAAVAAAAAALVLMMYLARDGGMLLFSLFMLTVFVFCLVVIGAGARMPLAMMFVPLGESSYPLYLFHRHFFGLLALVGIIVNDSLVGVGFTLLLFPLFYFGCRWLEWGDKRITNGISVRLPMMTDVHARESEI